MDVRPQTRLRIVQVLVNDKANTLENRLAAYWLEPGMKDREKVQQLKELHLEMERRRKEYDAALRAFHKGSGPRPRKPNLDFYAKFADQAKQDFREQARRSGTDAETAHFVQAGFARFAWITVNAMEACPDCRKRQGVVGDMALGPGGAAG